MTKSSVRHINRSKSQRTFPSAKLQRLCGAHAGSQPCRAAPPRAQAQPLSPGAVSATTDGKLRLKRSPVAGPHLTRSVFPAKWPCRHCSVPQGDPGAALLGRLGGEGTPRYIRTHPGPTKGPRCTSCSRTKESWCSWLSNGTKTSCSNPRGYATSWGKGTLQTRLRLVRKQGAQAARTDPCAHGVQRRRTGLW